MVHYRDTTDIRRWSVGLLLSLKMESLDRLTSLNHFVLSRIRDLHSRLNMSIYCECQAKPELKSIEKLKFQYL